MAVCIDSCSDRMQDEDNYVEDDVSKYSCSRDLKLSSYVSRNNKNSSCEEKMYRGPPKIVQWTGGESQHCHREISADGKIFKLIYSVGFFTNIFNCNKKRK